MTALLTPTPRQLFLNPSNGAPFSGGLVFTYAAGTPGTKQTTYVDSSGTTENTNPIVLDSLGEADIWLTPDLGYKFVFAYPTDTDPPTNPIWTVDNIFGSSLTGAVSPWAIASGTPDAITAAYSPPNASLPDGLLLGFRATAANLTSMPTFTPDAQPTYAITDSGGQPVLPGAIPGPNAEVLLRFNLPHTRWELLNPASNPVPWAVAGGTADALTASYTPANSQLSDGLLLSFRATANNATATPTFSPDGLAAHVFTQSGGAALMAGNFVNLGEYLARYNLAHTRWEVLNPSQITAVAPQLHSQTITATGTFTVPAGASTATVFRIRVVGAGGGGGSASGGSGSGGGGAGSGGYIEALVSGFTPGATVNVTVGALGAGSTSSGADGSAGTLSKVTLATIDFLTGNGGAGGKSGTGLNAGGMAGTTVENCTAAGLTLRSLVLSGVAEAGSPGDYSQSSIGFGGQGGSNPLGFGGGTTNVNAAVNAVTGLNGTGYGAAGAGGATRDTGSQNTGGNGTGGIVIFDWIL